MNGWIFSLRRDMQTARFNSVLYFRWWPHLLFRGFAKFGINIIYISFENWQKWCCDRNSGGKCTKKDAHSASIGKQHVPPTLYFELNRVIGGSGKRLFLFFKARNEVGTILRRFKNVWNFQYFSYRQFFIKLVSIITFLNRIVRSWDLTHG